MSAGKMILKNYNKTQRNDPRRVDPYHQAVDQARAKLHQVPVVGGLKPITPASRESQIAAIKLATP